MTPSFQHPNTPEQGSHSTYTNYMVDDDWFDVGCHYCRWESCGHESESAAQRAIDDHLPNTPEQED